MTVVFSASHTVNPAGHLHWHIHTLDSPRTSSSHANEFILNTLIPSVPHTLTAPWDSTAQTTVVVFFSRTATGTLSNFTKADAVVKSHVRFDSQPTSHSLQKPRQPLTLWDTLLLVKSQGVFESWVTGGQDPETNYSRKVLIKIHCLLGQNPAALVRILHYYGNLCQQPAIFINEA